MWRRIQRQKEILAMAAELDYQPNEAGQEPVPEQDRNHWNVWCLISRKSIFQQAAEAHEISSIRTVIRP